jgi:hypothetical protein
MSNEDEDYLDDPEMLNFDETLEARAAAEKTDPNEAFRLAMFGPTGRGSPDMDRQSPYKLSRNAAASLRSVGFEDESHLKDTEAWDTKLNEPRPQPQPQPRKQEKVVVKAAPRPMVKAKPRPENRNQFSDNDKYDQAAQDAADKLWLRMGHLPLRHQIGQQFEKLMQQRSHPQRNKGGTRKRNTKKRRSVRRNKKSSIRRRGGAYKKRSMRKHMRKHATRRR